MDVATRNLLTAPSQEEACGGCGEPTDNPWSYCNDCSAVLIDLSRAPEHRLNSPAIIDRQRVKILRYAESQGRKIDERT